MVKKAKLVSCVLISLTITMMSIFSFSGCAKTPAEKDEFKIPDKLVSFSLWDWQVSTNGEAKRYAQLIKDMGYRGVDFTFRWCCIEYEKGKYNFDYLDNILDEFYQSGLAISTSLLFWSINIPWMNDIEWQKTSAGNVYEFTGRGASPSFSDKATVDKMLEAFKAFCEHVVERYGKHISRIHARTSQYGELEYFCGSDFMLDYGQPAIDKFIKYLENKYKTINQLVLSYDCEQKFSSFFELNSVTPQKLSQLFYFDWQMFRQQEALNLSGKFDKVLEGISQTIPFAFQAGSLFDANASNKRGVFDPYLASKVCDIVHTDDGPGFAHDFSMDLIHVTNNVEYASEIDGFWHPTIQDAIKNGDKTLALYVRQAKMMGEAGIKYLNTANWNYVEAKEYQAPLGKYVTSFLGATERAARDESVAILINTADFIYKQTSMTNMLLTTYNSLSKKGTSKVRFVTDTQLIENPNLLSEIKKLYIGSTSFSYNIREDLVKLFIDSEIKLFCVENASEVAFKNEFNLPFSAQTNSSLKNKFNI